MILVHLLLLGSVQIESQMFFCLWFVLAFRILLGMAVLARVEHLLK